MGSHLFQCRTRGCKVYSRYVRCMQKGRQGVRKTERSVATFSYRKVFKQSSLLLRDSEVQMIIYDARPLYLWWPFTQTELVFDLLNLTIRLITSK